MNFSCTTTLQSTCIGDDGHGLLVVGGALGAGKVPPGQLGALVKSAVELYELNDATTN